MSKINDLFGVLAAAFAPISDPAEIKKRMEWDEKVFTLKKITNDHALLNEILAEIKEMPGIYETVKAALLRGESPEHILSIVRKWKPLLS